MKTDIHPEYKAVVFRDLGSGETFLTRSTVSSDKTIELDGVEYPVIDVEISSASHPFYTGKQRIMDSAGRVEKFNQRFKGFGGSSSKDPRLEGPVLLGERGLRRSRDDVRSRRRHPPSDGHAQRMRRPCARSMRRLSTGPDRSPLCSCSLVCHRWTPGSSFAVSSENS